GTDFRASPAARTFPGIPAEFLARFHVPAQQEVQGAAHLVLMQGEDPPPRGRALPAPLLVGRTDRDTIPAHRARVNVLLNRRHLRETGHSLHPPDYGRSSASCRSA